MMVEARPQAGEARSTRGPTLGRCPVCNYRLHGLPERHRCPECGFAYDARTRVWRARGHDVDRFRGFGRFAGWMTVLCALGLGACVLGFLRGNPTPLAQVLLTGVGLSCGAMVIGNVLLFRRRPFVALTPVGLVVREHWFTVRTVPWNQLGDLKQVVDMGAGTLEIRDRDGEMLTCLGSWFTASEVGDFMAAHAVLRQVYGVDSKTRQPHPPSGARRPNADE